MDLGRNRGDRKEKKIIELSKQIRKLNVALERERAAVSRMASRIKDLEASQAESTRQEPVPSDEKPAETKLLKERVAQLVRKVEEERIQSQSLRSELRHAQKCLVAEVGDEVAASKALNMPSGWKGRAQQIAMLKEKIRELSSVQQQCCHKCSEADPQNPLSDGSPDKEPDKARASLKKIELLRRQEFEKATQELQVLHSANSDMRKKNEASTARIKYLEKQMIDLKSKLELLLDKSGKDAALIKALQDELDKGSSQKPPAEDIVVRNLTILCAEQKEQIQQLEEQMQGLQRADQGQQLVGQDQSAEGYQSTIRSLTQENERIRRGKKLLEEQLAKWRACANGRGSPAVDDYDL
ncbi:hypothetical protein DFJ73DRAFT_817354 [Zopfochytrium polystomum]|nr:hypothetical protein DFJ73DRAFT_817354 [Zopfochytrium polystomum]